MLNNFLLILSHKNSTLREEQRQKILDTNGDRFIFYYFIGDMNLKSDYLVDDINNIVYLKVPDNYESLSMKVYYAMRFISENYLDKISGVFKTDDDIILDLDKILNCINENKSNLYFGNTLGSNSHDSTYHYGKCESEVINKTPVHVPDVKYCAGGGYYISKSIISNIINSKDIYESIIFEDVCTGLSMNRFGIFPSYVDIKRNGCMWGDLDNQIIGPIGDPINGVIQFLIPSKADSCRCGEIKNRRLFNFCQKCNKLY